jgi:hypothetical protein
MRSTILAVLLGCGLVAATLTPTAACGYHAASAANDQASPPQTAQAQPSTDDNSN